MLAVFKTIELAALISTLASLASAGLDLGSILHNALSRKLRRRLMDSFEIVMLGVSELGRPLPGMALVACTAALLALLRKRLEAVFVLATVSGPAISYLLKTLTRRARPGPGFDDGILSYFGRYSFPSGHVVFFEVFFGFLGHLAFTFLGGVYRWLLVMGCSLPILLVGPSRVFLGAHWASDVAGGYIIGWLWLVVLMAIYRKAIRLFRGC